MRDRSIDPEKQHGLVICFGGGKRNVGHWKPWEGKELWICVSFDPHFCLWELFLGIFSSMQYMLQGIYFSMVCIANIRNNPRVHQKQAG